MGGLETDGQFESIPCADTGGDHHHNGLEGGWHYGIEATREGEHRGPQGGPALGVTPRGPAGEPHLPVTYRGGVVSAQATLAFNRQLKAQGAYQTGADGCAPRCAARTHDQQGRGTAPICHTGARPHA